MSMDVSKELSTSIIKMEEWGEWRERKTGLWGNQWNFVPCEGLPSLCGRGNGETVRCKIFFLLLTTQLLLRSLVLLWSQSLFQISCTDLIIFEFNKFSLILMSSPYLSSANSACLNINSLLTNWEKGKLPSIYVISCLSHFLFLALQLLHKLMSTYTVFLHFVFHLFSLILDCEEAQTSLFLSRGLNLRIEPEVPL